MADLDVAVRLKFLTQGEEKLKAAARDLQAFGKATGKLSTTATGRLGGDLTRAWTASVKLGGALDKSAGAAKRTAASLNRIGAEARDIDRARVAVDRLAKSQGRLRDTRGRFLSGASGSRAGFGFDTAVAGGAIGGIAARRRREARATFLSEAASRVTPEGYLIGAGGAVIAGATIGATAAAGLAAVGVAAKEAIGRESAFADIQKKVNLDAGQSWDTLDRKVRKVSTTLGIGYEQAAAVFAQGGQGNIATGDLEDFAMLGAKVSTAWDVGAKEAAQMLTEIHGQTRWSNKELETFADKVNFLGDISAAAEKDIGAMWQRASAGAKAAGVSYDDSMVMMTALRGVGMQDEVAARFFGQFSSTLRRATSLKKGPQEAIKELGLTPQQVEKGMQTDAMSTMIDLLQRLDKAKNPVKIANTLFGGEWFDEALRMKESLSEIIRLREALAKGGYAGSLDKALTIDLGTTEAQLRRVKEALLDIMATTAKPAVLPAVKGVADWVTTKAQEMRDAQQRSEEARARATPVGESISSFERRLKLDRGSTSKPMFSQIEGMSPHIAQTTVGKPILDASQFGPAAEKITGEAADLYGALTKLNTTVQPVVDASAAVDPLDRITAAATRAAGALSAVRNFGVPSAGGVSVPASLTGGKGGSAPAPAAPAAAKPGKQTSLSRGGVHIAQAHFHGVKDVGALHRQLASLQTRAIRSSRDGALHDLA
jgi:TP901 family phage tail tape measure protein